MRHFPRGPRDWSTLTQVRDVLFIFAAIAAAVLAVLLVVQAMRTPAPFFGLNG